MAHEFCSACKPNTKFKCKHCPRGNVDWVKVWVSQGGVKPSRLSPLERMRYMAEWYIKLDESEEEHF